MSETKVTDILNDGIQAMHGQERMLDQMTPLITEIGRIIEDGNVQIKVLELREAIERRKRLG